LLIANHGHAALIAEDIDERIDSNLRAVQHTLNVIP
jgi:hypothetical protein